MVEFIDEDGDPIFVDKSHIIYVQGYKGENRCSIYLDHLSAERITIQGGYKKIKEKIYGKDWTK